MRFYISVILCLLVANLLVKTPASAQEARKITQNSPAPLIETDAGKSAYQTLRVEHLRIQTTHLKKKKNDKGVEAQLLSVLEDLAMYACSMMVSGEWEFQVTEAPSDCKQYLDTLTELKTPSTVPACIRSGKDSQACAQMFSSQQTRSIYDFASGSSETFRYENLGSGFSSSIPPLLRQKIQEVQFQLSATKEAEKITSLKRDLFRNQLQALAVSCTEQPLIFYKPLGALGIHKESFQGQRDPDTEKIKNLIKSYRDEITKEQKELKNEVTSLFEAPFSTPLPTPSPDTTNQKELVRIRLVSAQCMESIDSVLALMPLSAHAICKRDGIFHPTCIQAMKTRSPQDTLSLDSDLPETSKNSNDSQLTAF
jgi:hypothetical protein